MPLKPQSAKAKGRRFQQRLAASILEAFPHLEADDVVSTSMGANGEDVRLSPKAREHLPLSIEAKCVEKLNVWACLEQCEKNAPAGATACLVFSRNRAPTYAVVPWETLLALYRARSEGGALPPRLASLLAELARFAPTASADTPPPQSAETDVGCCNSGD